MLTYGSVCSGIEAATVAWEPLGMRPAWFAEIEPFPAALLAHRYPLVGNMGDMTHLPAFVRARLIDAPDVLVGGTPCQAFSIAGARAGLIDPRGQLTLSFADLADAIDEQRPNNECVIVWENVPGVLSDKTNAFGCFLAILAGEDEQLLPPGGKWPNAGCVVGLKRTIAWRVLDAQYFGVAQRRRRVFVVASARAGFDPTEVLFEFDGVRRDSPPSREARQDVAATLASRTGAGGFPGSDESMSGYVQPVAFGGNSQSGPIDVASARNACSSSSSSGRLDFETETFLVQGAAYGTLQANGKAAGSATQQDAESGMLVPVLAVALRGRDGGATAELGDEVAGCLRASGGGGDKAHVLAPIAFSSKDYGGDAMVDLSPTLRAGNHDTSHANAGSPPAVCFAENSRGELRLEGGDGQRTGALSTGGGKPGQGQPVVAFHVDAQPDQQRFDEHVNEAVTCSQKAGAMVGMAVRRLTPRECERLQASPDDYTAIPFGRYIRPEKLEDDWIKYLMRGGNMTLEQVCRAAADGPRYKALGNSMCTRNMRWIGERLLLTYSSLPGHTMQNQRTHHDQT